MIRKILFAFIIALFFLFLFKTDFVNAGCFTNLSICNNHFNTNHKSVCCRDGGCSSLCGTLDKWEYCYVECCYLIRGDGSYYDIRWYFKRIKCSVADTCIKGEYYLRPGICDSTGCTVGGIYKACCSKAEDGTRCVCSGGKNTGTCFYGNCYGPGITLTCPTGATPATPTPTPKPGTTPTPTPKPGAPTPTPAPGGDIIMCQLIKSFHLISSISSYLVHINPLKSEVFASWRIK